MAAGKGSNSEQTKRSREFQRLQKRLGRRVRQLRTDQGLTLEGLNERSGVDWRHIHKIESGTLNLTLVTLHRLAKGLGVSIPDLFESDRKQG